MKKRGKIFSLKVWIYGKPLYICPNKIITTMSKDQFFEREEDIVHLTDGVTSDYLYKKELEEMEYEAYMKGLHAELDKVQKDIELIQRALTDALCRREEILNKLK